MPRFLIRLAETTSQILLKFFTKTLPSLLLSSVIFVGGIWLLAMRIPGWSLFLGLPATQIGIVFLILTFDEVFRTKVGPENFKVISCSLCGLPTITPLGQKKDICLECQEKIIKEGK